MIKVYCDRCMQEMKQFEVVSMGNSRKELCQSCNKEFYKWITAFMCSFQPQKRLFEWITKNKPIQPIIQEKKQKIANNSTLRL